MDDEDEFVDAVEERDDDEQEDGGEGEDGQGVDDGGFGDDDFGDFGDFEEQQVGEEVEECDPDAEDFSQRIEGIRIHEPSSIHPPIIAQTPDIEFIDYKDKTRDQIREEVLHYLNRRFPSDDDPKPKDLPTTTERLDNERAMSLWNQLAAPVPLNPPDWKRSRIRRLFLVSLGIPVNLDEILPASGKKKKLVLPSTTPDTAGPTLSGKIPAAAPPFDLIAARHKAAVSGLALHGMTDDELLAHVELLKEMNSSASDNLTYWLERRQETLGEKESLEGVIESLVGWTERQRKGTTGIAMVPGRGKTPPPSAAQSGKKGKKK